MFAFHNWAAPPHRPARAVAAISAAALSVAAVLTGAAAIGASAHRLQLDRPPGASTAAGVAAAATGTRAAPVAVPVGTAGRLTILPAGYRAVNVTRQPTRRLPNGRLSAPLTTVELAQTAPTAEQATGLGYITVGIAQLSTDRVADVAARFRSATATVAGRRILWLPSASGQPILEFMIGRNLISVWGANASTADLQAIARGVEVAS